MIRLIILAMLVCGCVYAETALEQEKETQRPPPGYHLYEDVELSWDKDMNFSDLEGKMTQDAKKATWTGKKGNFDITISVDNYDPAVEFRSEWQKNGSKDKSEKKTKQEN